MTEFVQRYSAIDECASNSGRLGLLSWLRQAFSGKPLPQELPAGLYADLGIPPSQRPDFNRHCR